MNKKRKETSQNCIECNVEIAKLIENLDNGLLYKTYTIKTNENTCQKKPISKHLLNHCKKHCKDI